MSRITVYQKPTCTTCRKVYKVLQESNVSFDTVDYYIEPISKKKLKELIKKMAIAPSELIRKKEEIYKTLKIAGKNYSDEVLVDLMVQHPDLIQRPIVEKGHRAILARPAERISEIL